MATTSARADAVGGPGPAQAVPAAPTSASSVFRLLARAEAAKAGLPFDLVDAVMKIESDYSPARIGDVGEIGLMQVRPGTAAMLGFRGAPSELASPAINIHYGTLYLGQAWHLTGGDVCRTLMKYRAGHGQETMSALSATYCARARAHLVAINSPLADLVKPSDLVASVASEPTAAARGTSATPDASTSLRHKTGRAFWNVFEARVRAANARIEAKWKRVAAR